MPCWDRRRGPLARLRRPATLLYFPRLHSCYAARLSSRSAVAWISSSVTPGRRTARISSPSNSRRHARRLSAWLGRRDGLSHGEPERSTSSSSFRPQAHASVSVNVHRQMWNAPMFAHTNRTCCCPAPTTSLQSRKVISRLKRSATIPRISATLAEVSVQKNARHPFDSSTRTTRITPPAGRQVARNVLYFLTE